MLDKLDPGDLAQHSDALVAMLQDEDSTVRRRAAIVLDKLDPGDLARHSGTLVDMLHSTVGGRAVKVGLKA